MRQKHVIMSAFLLQPIAFGSWLPRIPDVQAALGLGHAALSIALLGMPLGILLVLPVATRILQRLGNRVTVGLSFCAMLIAMSVVVLSFSQPMLFFTLALAGASNTVLLLALNTAASNIEKSTGALILSTCHGFGSVGLMVGSLIGSGLAASPVSTSVSVALVSVAILPLILLMLRLLSDDKPNQHSAKLAVRKKWAFPEWPVLGICLFAFGIAMTEGAVADWSALYLREHIGASAGTAGIGFTIFAAMVALGRFYGDSMKAKIGAVKTASIGAGCALLGISIVLGAAHLWHAYFGLALLGLGVSVGYPLAVSAVAGINEHHAVNNVATLTFIALLGFLAGPPVIGLIAEYLSLQFGLAVLVPIISLSLLLARTLQSSDDQF